MADTLGAVNPLTYRGYVYDTETDLYYLESRYYDPAVGRFINGDAYAATGQGLLGNNMFAYCLNNPIAFSDYTGKSICASFAVALYDGGSGGAITSLPEVPPVRDVTQEVWLALKEEANHAVDYDEMTKFLFGDGGLATIAIYAQFYKQVNHKAPWDIKRSESWETTIKTPYPGFETVVSFDGLDMTPEELGNFAYGFLGYYYGISREMLIGGSYYAADLPIEGAVLANEIKDWKYVLLGYTYAEEQLRLQGS